MTARKSAGVGSFSMTGQFAVKAHVSSKERKSPMSSRLVLLITTFLFLVPSSLSAQTVANAPIENKLDPAIEKKAFDLVEGIADQISNLMRFAGACRLEIWSAILSIWSKEFATKFPIYMRGRIALAPSARLLTCFGRTTRNGHARFSKR